MCYLFFVVPSARRDLELWMLPVFCNCQVCLIHTTREKLSETVYSHVNDISSEASLSTAILIIITAFGYHILQ